MYGKSIRDKILYPVDGYIIYRSQEVYIFYSRVDHYRYINYPFFVILHDIRNNFCFYGIFRAPYTEPAALFMKFPTVFLYIGKLYIVFVLSRTSGLQGYNEVIDDPRQEYLLSCAWQKKRMWSLVRECHITADKETSHWDL